jgi:hypothetical protein
MSYKQKFDLVKNDILKFCKECVIENWERMFDMWLNCEADHTFGHGYQTIFKKEFNQYMNNHINDLLYVAAKNVVYAISTFVRYKKNAKVVDVIKFMEDFIEHQLEDFDNWCDEISMAMYEETSEYEREFGDKKEDPS